MEWKCAGLRSEKLFGCSWPQKNLRRVAITNPFGAKCELHFAHVWIKLIIKHKLTGAKTNVFIGKRRLNDEIKLSKINLSKMQVRVLLLYV